MSDPGESARTLPTGIVTFLFTDIEGSTRLLAELGDDYQAVLETHARLLRAAISDAGGIEVNTEGDAFFAVFATPTDALGAAAAGQLALAKEAWPDGRTVRVRMGAHSGEGRLGGDDYIGMDVHRAARIASAAHGGQVLVSQATRSLVAANGAFELRDLGSHQLKDLGAPERLYQLVAGDLPAEFPPPRAERIGNLPEPPTAFIGRAADIEAVSALLHEARLVTITGPGGSGKTRLALRVAADAAMRLPHGAFLVELDHLREPDLLLTAIAGSMDVAVGEDPPLPTLLGYLADKQLLLLLDNFEQILPAAADVDALIRGTKDVTILTTTQAPLGIYGEREYPVPPLATPGPDAATDPEALLEYEAVALFTTRAQAAKPSFRLDASNAAAVTEIVTRLEGQPLAIELAAARIKLLAPKAIAQRLEKRLDLLSSSARNLPERQRTLRGAIDWSYGLLEKAEQHVFDRLGVFAGMFGIEDAEPIVRADDECGIDLFDALASLVEKSLLRQVDLAEETRFSMLESIRGYAVERLTERGESDLLHGRLAEHVIELVEGAERHLDRTDDQGWFARLDTDSDNIRAALRWSIGRQDADLAERIAGPVWRYWVRKGLLAEGTYWTDEVIGLGGESDAGRAKTLLAQGSLAYWRGDYAGAEIPYRTALDLYRELDDAAGITEAAYDLGYAQNFTDPPDYEGSLEAFGIALERFRAADDTPMVQSTLFIIGFLRAGMGELDEAWDLIEESRVMAAGDVRPRSGLAAISLRRRDTDEARRQLMALADETKDVPDAAFRIVQIEHWAQIAALEGDPALGARLMGTVAKLRADIGGGPPPDRTVDVDPIAIAREELGDEATDAALASGAALGADEAITLARGAV